MDSEMLGNEITKGIMFLIKAVTMEVSDCNGKKDRIIGEEEVNPTEWAEF